MDISEVSLITETDKGISRKRAVDKYGFTCQKWDWDLNTTTKLSNFECDNFEQILQKSDSDIQTSEVSLRTDTDKETSERGWQKHLRIETDNYRTHEANNWMWWR